MVRSKTDQLIADGLSKLGYTTIMPNQRKVVEAYMKKKDVSLEVENHCVLRLRILFVTRNKVQVILQ